MKHDPTADQCNSNWKTFVTGYSARERQSRLKTPQSCPYSIHLAWIKSGGDLPWSLPGCW